MGTENPHIGCPVEVTIPEKKQKKKQKKSTKSFWQNESDLDGRDCWCIEGTCAQYLIRTSVYKKAVRYIGACLLYTSRCV